MELAKKINQELRNGYTIEEVVTKYYHNKVYTQEHIDLLESDDTLLQAWKSQGCIIEDIDIRLWFKITNVLDRKLGVWYGEKD